MQFDKERFAKELQLPTGPGFPILYLAAANDTKTVKVVAVTHLNGDVIADLDAGAVEELLAQSASRDLSELMANGDTSSDDSFLALLDGLRKMTVWPDGFIVTNPRVKTWNVDDGTGGRKFELELDVGWDWA